MIAAESDGHLCEAARTLGANAARIGAYAGHPRQAQAVDGWYRVIARGPIDPLCVNAGIDWAAVPRDGPAVELQMIDLNVAVRFSSPRRPGRTWSCVRAINVFRHPS